MKKFFMVSLVVIKMVVLVACTSNSSFDCPNQSGVSCRSLDQINRMVDNGQIRGRTQIDVGQLTKTDFSDSTVFQSLATSSVHLTGQPIRHGETVQRIWIAPYEDTDGNYHEDNLIYTITKGGHWIVHPVKTVRLI